MSSHLKLFCLATVLLLNAGAANAQFTGTGNGTVANPWHIGCGTTNPQSTTQARYAAVTAYISGTILYINGTGNMADFWCSGAPINGQAPWYWSHRSIIRTVVVGNNVTNIGDKAFEGCTALTTIERWGNVQRIGKKAFEGCTGLVSITIPHTVTEIEGEAFRNCINLRNVTIENHHTTLSFTGYNNRTAETICNSPHNHNTFNWFLNCPIETLHLGRNYTLSTAFSFHSDLFARTSTLQTLTIGSTVTELGYNAFKDCSSLKNVTLQDGGGLSIFAGAFDNCPIQLLYLGRTVSAVGGWQPFQGKTSLTTLTIGSNVTSMGFQAFSSCSGLTQITSHREMPPTIDVTTFRGIGNNNPNNVNVKVPCNSICAYQRDWSVASFTNYQSITNGCNSSCLSSINEIPADQLQIFPNPVKDKFFIKSELQIENIEMCDLSGRAVETLRATSLQNSVQTINVSALSQGVYLLKIQTNEGLAIRKLVKE